jgi:hypothetical protein
MDDGDHAGQKHEEKDGEMKLGSSLLRNHEDN